MYEVKFYRDKNGKSEIVEYLDELKRKGETSKNERVNRDKILAYIGALEQFGTRIGPTDSKTYRRAIVGTSTHCKPYIFLLLER